MSDNFNPQEIADEVTESAYGIKDPDYVVGLCSECKSTQPNSYMERSVFAQEGSPPPCRYCGGVVVITYGELQGEALNQSLDAARGIGSTVQPD